MQRIFTIFFLCILGFFSAYSQTTIEKNGKEFFNGDDRHLRVYLNNNYDQLDPIEGIWIFTRIEYNTWGVEVSRTPNEITAAIVRDPDNLRRAYVEVNMSRAFCKDYQITYSIQTGGGSGYYPCEPEGCGVVSGQYYFDYQQKTLSRPAISLMGDRAVLVGIKTFPQGPPTKILPDPGGTTSSASRQVTKRQPHIITHESGWEPHIDWDNQIFSSYILGTASTDPKLFHISDDYLGDPLSVVGIVIENPRYRSEVEIEIEPTKYSKGIKETFTMEGRGKQFAIYPKIVWDFDLLRCLDATPLNLTFKVSINGREPTIQTVTPNLRRIDDCPLFGYDYRGEATDLTFMAAAYVDEGSKIVTALKKEIREKGVVRDFVGLQQGVGGAIEIVYAFWQLLREKGISYGNATNNGQKSKNVLSQQIRLLVDVIDETQANCVDGTALFASCLAPSDIPPIIVLIPGHAFLGYTIGYIPQQGEKTQSEPVNLYLETTMLGNKAKFSAEFYDLIKTEPYSTMREILNKKFSKGNADAKTEIDYFIFATMTGNLRIKDEYKRNPYEVIEIDINSSRLLVRAIHRCDETTLPYLSTKPRSIIPTPTKKDDEQDNITPTYGKQKRETTTKLRRRGTKDYDNDVFLTDALDTDKDIFRVQIEKCSAFIPDKKEYLQLSKYGKIYPEYLLEKKSYRTILGEFDTEKAAQKAAKKAQSLGFEYVVIVRYQKGNRFESIYQDWKLISD